MSKSRDIADSAATINYIDNLTSDAQTQLNTLDTAVDNISVTSGTLTKTFAQDEVATITLSSSITTPVVSVTKEVSQTGVTNNTWDVNSTTENYTRLDSAPATTLDWSVDLSTTSFDKSFGVASQEAAPQGMTFNNDGTKMFVVGSSGDEVNEYALSIAYDVATASSIRVFSVSAQDTFPEAIAFNTDGTKMFILGSAGLDVNEYTLTTGFNVSTASYSQNFSVSAQDSNPKGLAFNNDGTKMYVVGNNGQDVNEYALSTGFDVSTASYTQNFSVATQEVDPNGIAFNRTGKQMFIVGGNGVEINSYTLSTAFDISTATYSQTFSVSGQASLPVDITFNNDDSKVYVLESFTDDEVNQYSISTLLSLGTGSFASTDVGKTIEANGGVFVLTSTAGAYSETTAPTSYAQVASGSWEMYAVVYNTTDGDLELSQGSGDGFDLSVASYTSVTLQANLVVDAAFNDDGTKLYTLNQSESVAEWSLSTPYLISSATYVTAFSVSSQDTAAGGLAFKSDGTKMYFVGTNTDTIYQYSLSTAWDISTASYDGTAFSVGSQLTAPYSIIFNNDGTTMMLVGGNNDTVYQYTLSTAWIISSAAYSGASLYVGAYDSTPTGIAFNADGSKLFVIGLNTDAVYQYSLPTNYSLSSASYDSVYFSVASQATQPTAIVFTPTGSKFIVPCQATNYIYEYSSQSFYNVSGYHALHTKTSTDTTYWTDINSMTADEAAGDGSIFYCVSTDDRSTWKIAHNTDGIRSIVRNNSGTWQYNSNGTYASTTWTNATTNTELNALQEAMTGASAFDSYDLTNASYDSVTFSTGGQDNNSQGFVFANSGTKAYIAGNTNRRIYEYTLSTAYDISTASYSSNSFYINEDSYINGVAISSDGTKMYVGGLATSSVYEYDLSTAYDVSTASYNSVSFNVSSQTTTTNGPIDIFFKPDGTKMYVSGQSPKYVWQYALSTAWDLSTASYDNKVSSEGVLTHFTISSDGTVLIKTAGTTVSKFNMSTAWDISTASSTADQTLDTTGTEAYNSGIGFNADGSKLILLGRTTNDALYQWSSTGTVSYPNQMNKTQLDAVSDANHFTLANDLDLGIIFNLSSGTTVPSSDGVSINYDANVLNKGAILGTDYDFDAPAATKVRITALAANNLKVRVV